MSIPPFAVTVTCLFTALTLSVSPARAQNSDTFVEKARLTTRIRLLQQTWQRDHVDHDPVSTQIMEAWVTGQQTTSVSVRLSVEPNDQMAHLNLVGTGSVQSSTVGMTQQARVDSVGNHTFRLVKPVFFDGQRFLTRPTHGQIQAGSRPVRVRTVVSGIPLLGAIGEQIAWSETLRRQPMADSITARRVADDLVPEFNEAVDRELEIANRSWSDMRAKLDSLLPGTVAWRAESTDQNLTIRIGESASPATRSVARPLQHATMKTDPVSVEDLVVSVSEQFVDELLDTLPLSQLLIPDSALEDFAGDLSVLTAESRRALNQLSDREPILYSMQLAPRAPLSVRFQQGRVGLMLRFRVIPKVGATTGIHRLTVWLGGADGGNGKWSVGIRDVDVVAEDRDEEPDMTKIIATQSRTMLMALPPSDIERLAEISRLTNLPDLRLWHVRSRDGILRASFQIAPRR